MTEEYFVILYIFSHMVQDVVFQWLTTDSIHLNQIDAEDPEVREILIMFLFTRNPSQVIQSNIGFSIVVNICREYEAIWVSVSLYARGASIKQK